MRFRTSLAANQRNDQDDPQMKAGGVRHDSAPLELGDFVCVQMRTNLPLRTYYSLLRKGVIAIPRNGTPPARRRRIKDRIFNLERWLG
jgi:hypothetical protein